jgi:predicted anti-sigma-YlaC factor YlaD
MDIKVGKQATLRMGQLFGVVLCLCFGTGCSIKRIAVNHLGYALADSGAVFSSDNDPILVKDAAPFSLKLMESLLAENPLHPGLLLGAARGFTQYSYAFVHQEADRWRNEDLEKSDIYTRRARLMYLRARDYGLRGLDVASPGFSGALRTNPREAVFGFKKVDVPLLYWTAAAWAGAISLSKNDPVLIADQPFVEALIDRALELDEAFDRGAIHTFLISYEMARQGAPDDGIRRARLHFERARELAGDQAAPLVSYAEAVCVQQQNRAEFQSLLEQALAIDPDKHPDNRLVNIILQERARWLLSRIDELFLPAAPEAKG